MRGVSVAAMAVLGPVIFPPAPAKAELLVSVSKSQQRLSVTIDGAETYRWPVSTGRRGHETPSGSFRPIRLERHSYSHEYEMTPMPWAMFFHRGYAVHGIMEAYNLGHAASHGCVRLRPDKAAILFSLMRHQGIANTKVVVMNGALPPLPGLTPSADAAPASVTEQTAKADDETSRELAVKAHASVEPSFDDQDTGTRRAAKFAKAMACRVSVSNDEAQILREREAWLRSLDRKYGITH
jgi:hypothetical protein